MCKGYCRHSGVSSGKSFAHASLTIKPWQSIYTTEFGEMTIFKIWSNGKLTQTLKCKTEDVC